MKSVVPVHVIADRIPLVHQMKYVMVQAAIVDPIQLVQVIWYVMALIVFV
jgi:hypothetical protein